MTGAAGGASSVGADANLQRCPEPLGTLAVDDGRTSSWFGPFTARTQITTIEPMVRLVVQQSNCFVIVAMGNSRLEGRMRGMIGDMRDSGEFRPGSSMQRGQRVAADYFMEPAILFSNVNTGGLGAGLGGWAGLAAGVAGSALSQSSTSVTMSVFDIRSGVQVAASEGSSTATNFGAALAGFGVGAGGALGGYQRTPAGQATVAAFVDAYNKMVVAVRNYRAQEVRGGLGTGGRLRVGRGGAPRTGMPAAAAAAGLALLLAPGRATRQVGGSGFGLTVQVCDPSGCRVQPTGLQTSVPSDDARLQRQQDPDLYRGEGVAALRDAAAAGDAGAAYRLGQAYEFGAGGLARNAGLAARHYEAAAGGGMPFAQFRLARLVEQGAAPGGRGRAVELYGAAAHGGVGQAAHNLGMVHLEGRGLRRNEAEAARWFTVAAENGITESQYNLALLTFRGQGVPRRSYEALQWMRRSAQNGYLPAQKAVGRLYMTGLEEMGQDLQEARTWLALAAGRGDAEARRWLAQVEAAERAERAIQQRLALLAAETAAMWASVALAIALAPPPPVVVVTW